MILISCCPDGCELQKFISNKKDFEMKYLFVLLFSLFTAVSYANDAALLGKWKTIDDETGQPKSIIEIYKEGEEYKGKVVELINPTEPNPTCKECQGDKKDKPVIGLEIIWGMKEKKAGEEWGGGEILDPKKGKVYKCRFRIQEAGEKLEVRGFIGFSLIGRSQTWLRVK
jgi:uncharacterized protein (DUF2147 family)